MIRIPTDPDDTGLEVVDLDRDANFAARRTRPRDHAKLVEGMLQLYDAFLRNSDDLLQQLVNAAIDLCAADSAGISIEQESESDENYWLWAAVAGEFAPFAKMVMPRYPSACGLCLERGKPQIVRVRQRFFELVGVEGKPVTDGLLIPWQSGDVRGTLWILSHTRPEAFDEVDLRTMLCLVDFAQSAMRHQQTLAHLGPEQAALELATDIAAQVNDQLRSLTLVSDLVIAVGQPGSDASYAADPERQRLAGLLSLLQLRSQAGPPS